MRWLIIALLAFTLHGCAGIAVGVVGAIHSYKQNERIEALEIKERQRLALEEDWFEEEDISEDEKVILPGPEI